jgi:hypothetical protein
MNWQWIRFQFTHSPATRSLRLAGTRLPVADEERICSLVAYGFETGIGVSGSDFTDTALAAAADELSVWRVR